MPRSYSAYSKQRKAIMQQVNRLEKRGYIVKERYHLPTVKELKAMTAKEQASVMRRAKTYTTERVRETAKMPVSETTKTGKTKQVTLTYEKARKRERSKSAKAGAETKRKKKEYQRKKEIAEEKYKAVADYDYDTMGDIADYEEPSHYEYTDYESDEEHYEIDEDTGEVIGEAKPEVDEAFERWAQEFIESAPLNDRYNAEAYVDALRQGDVPEGVNGYDEWLESIGEEPSSEDYLGGILDTLDQVNPSVADYLRGEADKYRGANPNAFEQRFREKEGNLPVINDILGSPRSGGADYGVNYGAITDLMKIITGKTTLSGAQMRAIGKALEQDENE